MKTDRREYFKQYNKTRPKTRRPNHEERVAAFKEKRKENPEYWRQYSNERYHANKNNDRPSNTKTYKMWWAARKRATSRGLAFDIERSDVVIPEICPICEEPMERPSLDRVDSSKGYLKSNIAVICTSCNTVKSFGTAELHRKIADWMDKKLSS